MPKIFCPCLAPLRMFSVKVAHSVGPPKNCIPFVFFALQCSIIVVVFVFTHVVVSGVQVGSHNHWKLIKSADSTSAFGTKSRMCCGTRAKRGRVRTQARANAINQTNTIRPKTASHATLCGAPQKNSLAMSTCGALNFGQKLFLTPPWRRPLRHDSAKDCFSRHPCGAHCDTIRPKSVSHATLAAPIAARFRPKVFLTPPFAVPPKICFSP